MSDPTAHKARLARAAKWVKEQWTKDATLADMLVEFEEFFDGRRIEAAERVDKKNSPTENPDWETL